MKKFSRRGWLAAAPVAAVPALAEPQGGAPAIHGVRVYNVIEFGARGDGKTLDTSAVQAAVDACHQDQGGTVLVPAGVFAIGTVELKSNVTLHIAAGGKLLGTADGKQYHAAEGIPLTGDSTLGDGNVGLLFAVGADNITVEGPGTIDGQGLQFRSPSRGVPPPSGRGGADRPYHLLFHRCNNLRVRDLTLLESAFHSIRVIQSNYVWMEGLHIHNRVNANNDGFHFISCEYTHVRGCDIQTQDDACALFGTCRFVTISDCTFSTRWSVFRFGGGNPENVAVSNCVIYETFGCPIKLHFGPGSRAQNLSFTNLMLHDVTGPIAIHVNHRGRNGEAATGERGYLRNISFQGIRGTVVAEARQYADMAFPQNYRPGETRQCIVLNALGDAVIDNVSFSDVRLTFGGGGTTEEAAREIPQVAGEYFEIGTPPAYGLYARNVTRLSLKDMRFDVAKADARPAIVFDHVVDAELGGVTAQGNPSAKAVLRMVDSSDVLITSPRVTGAAAVFVAAEGATKAVVIEGGDVSKAAVKMKPAV